MSSATKQKSSAAKNIFVFFLVFTILVAVIVVGFRLIFKNKNVTPSIAGFSVYIMDSDQMGDVVPRGSLVVTENGTPSPDKANKAYLCENVKGVGTSVFWLQGIESQGENVDGVIYTVYQEKNPLITYEIKSANIVGEATTYYTWAGKVITFASSNFGMVICIGSPIALLILLELIIAVASHDGDEEYEEDEDEEDEKHEKKVTLDDFLFAGDDKTPIDSEALSDNTPPAVDDYDTSAVDDYDTSAQIDGETEQTEYVRPEPIVRTQPKTVAKTVTNAETTAKASTQHLKKSSNASIEELMKMMEEQQKKLKDQMNDK